MTSQSKGVDFYRSTGKRALDVVISTVVLVLFCPLLLAVGALVRWKIGSPVFFRQQRPGKNGKPFVLLKFRTMRDAVGVEGMPLPDNERLDEFGRWLRSTSLDELPELLNVFKGDMSIVGPRPLLMRYLDRYTPEQARRHNVQPGITGWAQINGRNAMSWRQKFAYDVWYVDNVSVWLDLHIMYRTLGLVLARQGINQPGSATAEEFRGNMDE